MPILDFEGAADRTRMLDVYDTFVRRMLETKDSWIDGNAGIGMTIPAMVPRRHITGLFDLYGDCDPTFVGVDFNNGRMDRPWEVAGPILSHFADEGEERTFLYGINVKPYRKGYDTSAWDIYLTHGSFNAIGPMHVRAALGSPSDDWIDTDRVFDRDTISYTRVDKTGMEDFAAWMQDRYGRDFDKGPGRGGNGLGKYLKRYNFEEANVVLGRLSEAIRNGDSDYIAMVRDRMPEEMRSVDVMGDETGSPR